MKPTPEQDAIRKSPAPLKVVIANAGTGKTATIVMTAVRLYLQEEAEYVERAARAGRAPRTDAQGHLMDPDDIQRVAQLFDLITFTRKAAAEMEERFRAALAARCKVANYGSCPLLVKQVCASVFFGHGAPLLLATGSRQTSAPRLLSPKVDKNPNYLRFNSCTMAKLKSSRLRAPRSAVAARAESPGIGFKKLLMPWGIKSDRRRYNS
jgi:hypothetical protein